MAPSLPAQPLASARIWQRSFEPLPAFSGEIVTWRACVYSRHCAARSRICSSRQAMHKWPRYLPRGELPIRTAGLFGAGKSGQRPPKGDTTEVPALAALCANRAVDQEAICPVGDSDLLINMFSSGTCPCTDRYQHRQLASCHANLKSRIGFDGRCSLQAEVSDIADTR